MPIFNDYEAEVIVISGTKMAMLVILVVIGLHYLATYIFHFQVKYITGGVLVALLINYLWFLYSLHKG